ncbi:MAG: sulfatase [Bacteroidetes bacterium]|nr:sulfatase [Bacteroidota bacterium]
MNTSIIKSFLSFFLLASPFLKIEAKNVKQEKPNIIVILADDLGYGDLVCYGGTKLETPNIDRLAANGIRFTSGYAPAGTSTPSRYSLLTGQYAWRKKVSILPGTAPMSISQKSLTLAGMMHQAGYATGCVGKWHLGLGDGKLDYNKLVKPSPNDIGFDYSFIFPATNDRTPCVYMENGKVVGLDSNDPIQVSYGKPVGNWPTGLEHPELLTLKYKQGHDQTIVNGVSRIGYMTGGTNALWKDEDMTDVLTGKAVNYIRQNAQKPFFLYFATHSIHEPRIPNPRFKGSSECGVYGDVIQELDWSVGEILKTLEEMKIRKNTLIVFLSDNGSAVRFEFGYKDGGLENLNGHEPAGVLKDDKNSLYEGGTRTPFIVSWPVRIKPAVSDAPVGFIDLFASFAKLLNVNLQEGDAPDSRNALPVLLGKATKTKHNEVLIQNDGGKLAIRIGDWKFIPKESYGKDELYNLRNDISEKLNVAEGNSEIVKNFRRRLEVIRNTPNVRK